MKLRYTGLIAASIAALAPVIADASPEKAALNACAHAFASSLAGPGATVPAYKVAYRGDRYVGSMLEFYTREYTFDLYANDLKSGLPIARASCSTNSLGNVIALSSVPLKSAGPALASQR